MIQTAPKLMTLEEFLDWYPDGCGRYELHNGVIVEMQPIGPHEQVIGLLNQKCAIEIDRQSLPCFIPKQVIVQPIETNRSGYNPDLILLNQPALESEPLWKKRSTITKGESVRLIIEVVSTNWQDDYLTKLKDYEALGIPEYWIVDYLGLGGRRYIGSPKQPTISIYIWIEGEYEVQQFRSGDRLISPTFPNLTLTADQIFNAGT